MQQLNNLIDQNNNNKNEEEIKITKHVRSAG